jgi:F-type H+-transporting ATPase subunit b
MPQFDIATFASQIFWLGVCFICLLVFSAKVGLPALAKVLQVRWQHIEGTLEEANALQQQAQALVDAFETDMAQARKQAHQGVIDASRDAAQELSRQKMVLAHTHKQRFRDSERVILQKKATTMGYVQDIATDVTDAFVTTLLSYRLAQTSIQEAVEERAEQEKRSHVV